MDSKTLFRIHQPISSQQHRVALLPAPHPLFLFLSVSGVACGGLSAPVTHRVQGNFYFLKYCPSAFGGPENHRCPVVSNWKCYRPVGINQPLNGSRQRRMRTKNNTVLLGCGRFQSDQMAMTNPSRGSLPHPECVIQIAFWHQMALGP